MARKAQNKPEKTAESVEAIDTVAPIEEVPTPAVTETVPLSACGGTLRAAREKQKLSVQDVASQLRLGVKQIDALESDRYDKLPQPSIVRGFIRNYAKLLKIDAAPIIEAYGILVPNTTPQSFAVKSNARASVIGESRAHFSFKLFIGLIIAFALVAWFFYYYTQVIKPNVLSELSESTVPESETIPPSVSTEFALPAAERKADTSIPIELPIPESDSTNSTAQASSTTSAAPQTLAPSSAPTATPAESSSDTATTVKPSVTPAPAVLPAPTNQSDNQQNVEQQSISEAKTARLAIDATEETWVNITDANGKQIYSKVLASGTSETITASPPLSITVGNAYGTTISINGSPLDLLAHTRDRVARLKVK